MYLHEHFFTSEYVTLVSICGVLTGEQHAEWLSPPLPSGRGQHLREWNRMETVL